jgi:hypothetical protein
MILLWGLGSDKPMASVRAELARLGCNALLVDQRAVLETMISLDIGDAAGCILEWDGVRLDLAHVRAAYLRPYDPYGVPAVAELPPDHCGRRHAGAVYDGLRLWGDMSTSCVVNRLGTMGSNSSKPYQGELIRYAGFSIPETLVTTDPDAVHAFYERHGQIVYKSVSGVRSVVSRLSAARRDEVNRVTACPTQFQQHIPGVDYRVHVVGADVFVCELESTVDDYRYADRQGGVVGRQQSAIPDDQAARCVALAASLGLRIAGVDLRRTPDGDWYCFEVNPSPAFSWFDAPDERIACSVAKLLAAA